MLRVASLLLVLLLGACAPAELPALAEVRLDGVPNRRSILVPEDGSSVQVELRW